MTMRTDPSSDFLSIFGGRAGVLAAGVTAANPLDGLRRLVRRLLRDDARKRQLRHLATLEPHLLQDVGVTRAEVLEELRRG